MNDKIGPKTQALLDEIRMLVSVIRENEAAFMASPEGQKPMFRPTLGEPYLEHVYSQYIAAGFEFKRALRGMETPMERLVELEKAAKAAKELHERVRRPIERFYDARRELSAAILAETGIIDQPTY